MKTVFESEGAALKFIEYNSDDIVREGGYRPKRAYYCDLCCGWHVTGRASYSGKSPYRKAIDEAIENDRKKKERREIKRTQTKKEENEVRLMRPTRLVVKPAKSNGTPFLSEAMRMAEKAIELLRDGKKDEAWHEIVAIYSLFDKMKLAQIKGAKHTKRDFLKCMEGLKEILEEGEVLSAEMVDAVAEKFEQIRDYYWGVFCYDPNTHLDLEFKVTPANIDEVIAQMPVINGDIIRNEQELFAQENRLRYETTLRIIDSARASIVCGDFDEAKADILQAIEAAEKCSKGKRRRLIGILRGLVAEYHAAVGA